MPCLNLLPDYNNLLLDYNNLLLDYNNLLPDYNNPIIIYYYYNPRININPSCPVEVNLLAVSSKRVQRSEENKLGRRKHLQALRHWYGNNRIAPPYY